MAVSKNFVPLNLTARRRAEMLDETKWSNEFIWDDIEILAEYMDIFKVPRGVTVFEQGDTQQFMGLVQRGKVEILKEDSKRNRRLISIIGPDKTLGEMALIDGQPRSATAITSEETVMFILTKTRFEEMSDARHKVWGMLLLKLCKLMSQRLRETSGELVDFLGNTTTPHR